jgi:hypothetical protein
MSAQVERRTEMPKQIKIHPEEIGKALSDISNRLRQIRDGKLAPASTEYERQGDRISVRIVTGAEDPSATAAEKSSR